MLPPTTNGGTRQGLQGLGEPNPISPAPCPHHGRGPTRRLGQHLPKNFPHHISSLCEMARADNPSLPTPPAATLGLLHRSSYPMGSQTHNTPNREQRTQSLCFLDHHPRRLYRVSRDKSHHPLYKRPSADLRATRPQGRMESQA